MNPNIKQHSMAKNDLLKKKILKVLVTEVGSSNRDSRIEQLMRRIETLDRRWRRQMSHFYKVEFKKPYTAPGNADAVRAQLKKMGLE